MLTVLFSLLGFPVVELSNKICIGLSSANPNTTVLVLTFSGDLVVGGSAGDELDCEDFNLALSSNMLRGRL